MYLIDLIPTPMWRDIVDILFLTIVAYQLYAWFRESRALRVIIGLVALGGVYSLGQIVGFVSDHLGLSNLMASASHFVADSVSERNSSGA